MKCKQKLCNRTKNICPNGNCNVCAETINEAQKQQQKHRNKKPNEKIKVDVTKNSTKDGDCKNTQRCILNP